MVFNKRFLWLLVAVVLLLAACTGIHSDSSEVFTAVDNTATVTTDNEVVAGYNSGVVPWEITEEEFIVPVSVKADPELMPGDGKMTMSLTGVPFELPESAAGYRGVSALIDGGEFYYSANVYESEVQGYTFDPSNGKAFACYELPLEGEAPYTVAVSWYSLPTDMNSYYLGIGDRQRGVWHWYYGPNDGVLTFDPGVWSGGAMGDTMVVCVLLESGKPADFHLLKSNVPEVRGTGLIYDAKAMQAAATPPEDGVREVSAVGWANKVDLKPYSAPIANQGSIGSCTAFGIADSAFTVLLNQLYATYGWDVSEDAYRSSAMWTYVKSGMSPYGNFDPLCGGSVGRYMSQPLNLLKNDGAPTAETVPYVATSNCSTTFPLDAYAEADLLKINSWSLMSNFGLVNSIKEQLAVYNRPVPIAMYGLESAFLNYNDGVYHYGGTQGVSGGHAMCIIGYDDDLEAFEVRNSWGTGWGLDGYWWCGYDAVADLAELSRFSGYSLDVIANPDAVEFFFDEEAPADFDEIEPNNTTGTATALPEFSFTSFTGEIDEADLVDVVSFDYTVGSNTTVTVSYNASQTRLDVRLLDSSGTILATATGDYGNQTISGVWSSEGTAYIVMQCAYGSGTYTIAGTATMPPDKPTGLTAAIGTAETGVALSWEAVEHCNNYTIQRALDAAGPYSQLATTYDPAYTDLNVDLWEPYWYRVMAVNNEGTSIPSEPVQGYTAVAAPTDVMATDGGEAGSVTISWTVDPAAEEYVIKRSVAEDGKYVSLGTFAESPVEDTQIVEGTVYYYIVSAGHEGLEGPASTPESGYAGGGALDNEGDAVVPNDGDQLDPGGMTDPGLDTGGRVIVDS